MAKVLTSVDTTAYLESFDITYGTAQGSCLGPLLFILLCNDVYRLPLYGRLILFAVDTTLLCKHKSEQFLEYILNHDMELLHAWFKANQLSLNMTKTVLMTFQDNKPIKVEVDGEEIPKVKCTKFLGLNLDDHLTWDAHVDAIYGKLMAN